MALFDDQGRYIGPEVTDAMVAQYRAAERAAAYKPEGFKSWSAAQKNAWYQNWLQANNAYIEMQKRSGYGGSGHVRGESTGDGDLPPLLAAPTGGGGGGGGTGGAGTGALPPIYPGEDSMAYMLRIGMDPAKAQAALTISQQNPGMTFQDIMARLDAGGTSVPPPVYPQNPAPPYTGPITPGTAPRPGGGGILPTVPNPFPDPLIPPGGLPVGGGGGGGGYVPGSGAIPPQYGAAGERSPYAAINLLLPGYGLTPNRSGFGIPGFDTGMVQPLGGSWAGSTFTGPGEATGGTQFDPAYDPWSVWKKGQEATPQTPGVGGVPSNVANYDVNGRITLGPVNPATGQRASPGMIWQFKPGGGDAPGDGVWIQVVDDVSGGGGTGGGTGGTGGTGTTGGQTQTIGGWGIQKAVPWLTTSYLQTYGGKAAPFANIHEQIGNAMQGHPAALPTFQWSIPEEMFAAQPGATGMPPGGWTQMLGYTPGAPSNYGFLGGRPNPYGPAFGAVGINPTIG